MLSVISLGFSVTRLTSLFGTLSSIKAGTHDHRIQLTIPHMKGLLCDVTQPSTLWPTRTVHFKGFWLSDSLMLTYHYRKVPNKHAQHVDKHSGDSGGPGKHFGGFSANFANFDKFWAIFSEIFHHKVLGAHLFK